MRGQTATEYLIIIAVVIVISVIVVSILGGVPNMGSNTEKRANDASISTLAVGITDYAISDYNTKLFVRNNRQSAIIITAITINNIICSDFTAITLVSGRKAEIDCPDVFEIEQDSATYDFAINYTDILTNANYEINGNHYLIAPTIADEYQSILDNSGIYNSTNNGCWNWSGTSSTTGICTCADLNGIKTNTSTLQSNYVLLNNIDFNRCANKFGSTYDYTSGSGWTPIGDASVAFIGEFDGQNYSIHNLFIDVAGSVIGLFGDTYQGVSMYGLIENVNLIDVDISGVSYVGGLVGSAAETGILNSYVTGTVTGSGNLIGGLAGFFSFENISDSYSTATVSGTNYVGGLVGAFQYGAINNSYATGAVSGGTMVGGLVGYSTGVDLDTTYATGAVTCTTSYCGGLVGSNISALALYNTNSFANISTDDAVNCIGGAADQEDGTNSTCTVT